MKIGKDIMSAVRKASNAIVPSLTDDDIYSSPEFSEYVQNLTDTITGNYKVPVTVKIIHDSSGEIIAYTDGKGMTLNYANPIMRHYSTMLNRFMAQLGVIFHEISHIIFLDFNAENKAMEFIQQGKLFGEMPPTATSEEAVALIEMMDALGTPEYRPIFEKVYLEISNIISDPHDEEKLCEAFGGLIENGIIMARESLRSRFPSLEEITAKGSGYEPLAIMFNLILQFARFGEVIMEDSVAGFKNEYMQSLVKLAQPLDIARYTDNTAEKFSQINRLLLVLWPYIKKVLDEVDKSQQNQQGQSQQSQSQQGQQQQGPQGSKKVPSQQAIQSVLNQLNKACSNAGTTQAPKGRKSSKQASANAKIAAKGNQPAKSAAATQPTASNEADAKSALDGLLRAIATQRAEENMEQDLTSSRITEIQTIDMNSTHKGLSVYVKRFITVTAANKALYHDKMQGLFGYSKRLQKQMKDALRDLKEGSIMHHRSFGNRFEAKEAYRLDQRCYANKKQPQDLPDMAISILVDHSGSMSGPRLNAAMKASMLLHDFATGMKIPVHVAGHNTTVGGINYFIYTDFDTVGDKDKYRLAKMSSGSCNRDGMAIEVAANLLSKREEDVKILIVISDGQPNDSGYGGESAQKDISSIIKKYQRKGIQTFGAAIGDDKDRIKQIYGDGFLDITDLSLLPKTMVALVKKRILG